MTLAGLDERTVWWYAAMMIDELDDDGVDLSKLSAAGVSALHALYGFEAELRRLGIRPVSRITGVPTMTVQRWCWLHSDRFGAALTRLFGDD